MQPQTKRPPGRPKTDPDRKLKRRTVRLTDQEWQRCLQAGDASKFIRELIKQASP